MSDETHQKLSKESEERFKRIQSAFLDPVIKRALEILKEYEGQ